jgi:ZIP family zinc transporter
VDNVWTALALTTFAGMATGIGAAIAFFAKRTNYRFLSVATGFSAGVMLYVSFVEIFVKGANALTKEYGDFRGYAINTLAFFGGMALIFLIDNLIPAGENPHETHSEAEIAPLHDTTAAAPRETVTPGLTITEPGLHDHTPDHHKLMRMGLFTALAIGIHNFPEGLATFLAALQDPGLGLAIAIAIALHNIPEGISVSVPIYYATGNRKKAFVYALLSGLSEPVGAVIAYLALILVLGGEDVPQALMGILFAGVAGIMVYISLDELLPTSRAYGKGHDSLYGLVGGMLVMAISLVIMK